MFYIFITVLSVLNSIDPSLKGRLSQQSKAFQGFPQGVNLLSYLSWSRLTNDFTVFSSF